MPFCCSCLSIKCFNTISDKISEAFNCVWRMRKGGLMCFHSLPLNEMKWISKYLRWYVKSVNIYLTIHQKIDVWNSECLLKSKLEDIQKMAYFSMNIFEGQRLPQLGLGVVRVSSPFTCHRKNPRAKWFSMAHKRQFMTKPWELTGYWKSPKYIWNMPWRGDWALGV